MKEKISRICLIVYVVILLLSGFVGTPPGGHLPFGIILIALALPPAIIGKRKYRVFGFVALSLALVGTVLDFKSGQKHKKELSDRHQLLNNINE
jgi:hypothetical protein